jgi:hypothetical protein
MDTRRNGGNGALIVLSAPLTKAIDHAGYFIKMSMASLPMWLESILNRKYPSWRNVEPTSDAPLDTCLPASRHWRGVAGGAPCCFDQEGSTAAGVIRPSAPASDRLWLRATRGREQPGCPRG